MQFFENELYHIYNRGNNKQKIFFKPENYLFFLKKVRKFFQPHCDILAWCRITFISLLMRTTELYKQEQLPAAKEMY